MAGSADGLEEDDDVRASRRTSHTKEMGSSGMAHNRSSVIEPIVMPAIVEMDQGSSAHLQPLVADEAADSENDFPELGQNTELRRFQLEACAHLPNTVHLREALAAAGPGRAQQNQQGTTTLSPLETACQAGRIDNVRLLLKDVDDKDGALESVARGKHDRHLALAVDSGAADVVRLLLENHASPNVENAGATNNAERLPLRPPLLAAVRDRRLEIVEALCAVPSTNVNAQDARGATALHEAVTCRSPQDRLRGDAEAVVALLARRASPAIPDARGWTPVHLAAHIGDVDVLRRLLEAGASIDGMSVGQTAVEGMVAGEPPSAAGAIAAVHARRRPAAGWAPLHLLLARGDEGIVRQMIEWHADTCKRGGPDEMNPLMLAISLGHEGVALQLLNLSSVRERVDEQDRRGRCALHFLVMAPAASVTLVRALLEVNASPDLRNENGLSPIDAARNAGLSEESQVVKKLQVEEVVRLVMRRNRCRSQNKYEESELIRGDLKLRGVSLDIQSEKWVLPDGTWGYLAADRERAQAQGGPGADGQPLLSESGRIPLSESGRVPISRWRMKE